MDNFSGLLAFVRAAQARSYVAASERLGLSASAVAKSVMRLEQRVGVRLLNRSTRRISLTEEGALFLARAQRIIAELEAAEAELSRATATPSGKLRISLPAIGYRMLMPILPEFQRLYPDIALDLDFNDELVDVIEQGFDAVIRSGDMVDSQLRSRRLGPFRFLLVAAPVYFARHGSPRVPEDLLSHACLHYRFPSTGQLQQWRIEEGTRALAGRLPVSLVCNSVESLIFAARRGLGLAYVPDFAVREALSSGALISVLDECSRAGGSFSILWPSNRHLPPKLRVFIDYVVDSLPLTAAATNSDRMKSARRKPKNDRLPGRQEKR